MCFTTLYSFLEHNAICQNHDSQVSSGSQDFYFFIFLQTRSFQLRSFGSKNDSTIFLAKFQIISYYFPHVKTRCSVSQVSCLRANYYSCELAHDSICEQFASFLRSHKFSTKSYLWSIFRKIIPRTNFSEFQCNLVKILFLF